MRAMILGTAMAAMVVGLALAADDRAEISVGETSLNVSIWDEPPVRAAVDQFFKACHGLHPNSVYKIEAQVHEATSPLKPQQAWGRHVMIFVAPLYPRDSTMQYAVGVAADGSDAGIAAWGPMAQDRCGWDIRAEQDGAVYFTPLDPFVLPEPLKLPAPNPTDHW
ncbi:hypothetical protein [Rhodospirillum sp. A1_3_36]|uniref:hypothetical protein n=1 Tax=Rhodospirillum sp. A1_3_36 TaxID=3391666 RepID=UPI0039A53F1B